MIEEVRLPEISENVTTGDVIQVLVKVGDFIKKDQSIVELETEKATFEVPSSVAGKITEVKLKPNQKINVGDVIIKVDTEAKAGQQPPVAKPEPAPKPAPSPKSPLEREKPAPTPPVEKERPIPPPMQKPSMEKEKITTPPQAEKSAAIAASPTVRHLADELGVDVEKVHGTGPDGRITEDDVKQYTRQIITGAPVAPESAPVLPLPDFTKWGSVEREAMTVTRKKIAETLSFAWHTIPHVAHFDHADITALEEFRKEYAPKVEQAGGKLTVTSILLKVVAEAMKLFPKFNASVDTDAQEIIYKKYYHISVAVDTDRGLLVPVIRDVDRKTILQLAVELAKLSARTRAHQVMPDEMVGGNFTVSNLGGIGGTNFAPVIYWPQVAILGISRAVLQPVHIDGQFVPRLILPLSVSYDHRIIDGSEAARFLRWIADALEKPFLLIMHE
jgi:pyruvate dehydrogenase E2 component (dihydrolipoamide acetyltransferase)